jgi:hypothetical protein
VLLSVDTVASMHMQSTLMFDQSRLLQGSCPKTGLRCDHVPVIMPEKQVSDNTWVAKARS